MRDNTEPVPAVAESSSCISTHVQKMHVSYFRGSFKPCDEEIFCQWPLYPWSKVTYTRNLKRRGRCLGHKVTVWGIRSLLTTKQANASKNVSLCSCGVLTRTCILCGVFTRTHTYLYIVWRTHTYLYIVWRTYTYSHVLVYCVAYSHVLIYCVAYSHVLVYCVAYSQVLVYISKYTTCIRLFCFTIQVIMADSCHIVYTIKVPDTTEENKAIHKRARTPTGCSHWYMSIWHVYTDTVDQASGPPLFNCWVTLSSFVLSCCRIG